MSEKKSVVVQWEPGERTVVELCEDRLRISYQYEEEPGLWRYWQPQCASLSLEELRYALDELGVEL